MELRTSGTSLRSRQDLLRRSRFILRCSLYARRLRHQKALPCSYPASYVTGKNLNHSDGSLAPFPRSCAHIFGLPFTYALFLLSYLRVWNRLLRWGIVPPYQSDRCLRLHYWAKVACTWLSNMYEAAFTYKNFGFIQWVDKEHWTTWGSGEADVSSARPSWWTKCFVFHFSADTTPQFLKTLSVYFFWPVKGQHERIRASKFLWQLLGHEWDQGQWMRNCVCLDIMCKIFQEWRIGGMDKLPLRNSALYLHDFGFQVKQGSHWQEWAVPPGRSMQARQALFYFYLFIFFRQRALL